MNARLKQLAEQAQKVVGYTDGGYTEIKALDQEKFAELIVRECASFMNEYAINGDVRNGNDLLKHFGVEE